MNRNTTNVRNLLALAAALVFAGCGTDVGDDTALDTGEPISTVDYAQTFGGPDFPLPEAMRIDPGDEVESYQRACERQRDPETQKWAESIQGAAARCVPLAQADCKADGGVVLGHSVTSYQRIAATETRLERWFAHVSARCLFNVGDAG